MWCYRQPFKTGIDKKRKKTNQKTFLNDEYMRRNFENNGKKNENGRSNSWHSDMVTYKWKEWQNERII